jgi:AcrR family transcriptional regulator
MAGVKKSGRTESAEATRAALLDAGVRILARDPATSAFGHLKAPLVAAEAGRTIGAFFHHWESQSEYVDSLITHVLTVFPSTGLDLIKQHASQLMTGAKTDPMEALLDACRDVQSTIPRDAQTVVELLLWAAAPRDAHIADLARSGYRVLDDQNEEFFSLVVDLLGRRLRPPITSRSLGVLFASIGEAIALRRAIEPNVLPEDAFGWTVVALLSLLSVPAGEQTEPPSVAATVARLNLFGPDSTSSLL